jgi:hypothetical protein
MHEPTNSLARDQLHLSSTWLRVEMMIYPDSWPVTSRCQYLDRPRLRSRFDYGYRHLLPLGQKTPQDNIHHA